MADIYDIKKRADELSAKWKTESIPPEEVGDLIRDLADYANQTEINGSSLGIRKTYATVSAMEADSNPVDDKDGTPLRRGMLVNIYNQDDASAPDNGKVFSWQNPGWQLRTKLDAGYATTEQVDAIKTEQDEKFSELEEKIGEGVGGALGGYKTVDSIDNLPPIGEENIGYIVGTKLYIYVGEGGDTLDGKYKDVGEFRGPQGEPGKPGEDGKNGADGVSLGEIALVQETGTDSGSENKVMSQKAVSQEILKLKDEAAIPDDLKNLQLAGILNKKVNKGYRISTTGTETKDGSYNHVSFDASPNDVIIFRGGKAANIYTNFLLIEKADGSYESLTYRSQYDNVLSTVEVSLKTYADIKKVHYNDDASSTLELYKTSNGIAYYALSQKLKNSFTDRTNYYQSAVNVLDPNDPEARKDGSYNNMNVFTPNAVYQGITVPAEFGNTYYVIRDNGREVELNSNSYPILYLDDNKDIVQVKKIGLIKSIFVDDIRCKYLRFSIAGMQSSQKIGVIRNSKKYVEYGEVSEPNVLKDFGEKSLNIFDWNTMIEGKGLRTTGYNQTMNSRMVKIPVKRGTKYAIGIYPNFTMQLIGESNFIDDAIGILTDDNKTLGTIVRFKQLPFNEAHTNFIYTTEESYNLNDSLYEGNIYLCFNTKINGAIHEIDIRGLVVQEGENITTAYPNNYIKSNEFKSIYSVSHLHFGDSNSFGFGAPQQTKTVNRYIYSGFLDMCYGINNKGASATGISYVYNQILEMPAGELKKYRLISIMHGTNCYMDANAKDSAQIPDESFADIPYTYGEDVQVNTIEEHCARFGKDTYSQYCMVIERILYENPTVILAFISIPTFAKDKGLENKRKVTNTVIKEICEVYALPFIDAANNAGISSRSVNKFSNDGTHLYGEEANYKWWGYVSSQLRSLCFNIYGKDLIEAIRDNY